jgi:peptidoglycan/xylan/chitin deacetylase (PgdA/CDA1 family)
MLAPVPAKGSLPASGVRIALTIDTEHPSRPAQAGNAERIVAALASAGARATFFVEGRWATAYPELARRIAADGHLVANHSRWHAAMTALSDEGIRRTVLDGAENVRRVTGVETRPWFRCPYGDGFDDARVLAGIEAADHRHVHWDVDTVDWDERTSADDVTARIVGAAAEPGDGAIVLVHSWPDPTAVALPAAIAGLRAAGATLVRLDELDRPAAGTA